MTTEKTLHPQQGCPSCSKPIESPHHASIVDQSYDSRTKRQYVRTRSMTFCSTVCGGNYQCGCEL